MKHALLFITFVFSVISAMAQSPQAFNYQASVRDNQGELLSNTNIGVRITLRSGSTNGASVYSERHTATTDNTGVFAIQIGNGSMLSGSFSGINWGNNNHFVQVEIDVNGGTSYSSLGTFQLLSVPYALYGEDADADPTNEQIENITLNGTTLSISEGSNTQSVSLASLAGGGTSIWSLDESTAYYMGSASLRGINGNNNVNLSFLENYPNNGWFGVQNASGEDKVRIFTAPENYGYLETFGANGSTNVKICNCAESDNGYLGVYENNSFLRAEIYSDINYVGVLGTYGNNGFTNTYTSYLAGYPNHGYTTVMDGSGTNKAGMFVDANGFGAIFGDLKNFRMDHPTQEDKEIWYASLEGPEAAAYERGTAQLTNGEVFVSFSETFGIVSNPETMTIILTPLSAASKGLAVVEKMSNGFRVKELMQGTGNYSFDWEVKAVRKGYEDYQVVRDKSTSAIHINKLMQDKKK